MHDRLLGEVLVCNCQGNKGAAAYPAYRLSAGRKVGGEEHAGDEGRNCDYGNFGCQFERSGDVSSVLSFIAIRDQRLGCKGGSLRPLFEHLVDGVSD
jgi:hypothetical protein